VRSFEGNRLEEFRLPQSLVRTMRRIGEYTGREQMYQNQLPQELEKLRQVAIIQSAESSNRIEGVTAPPGRIRELMEKRTTPRDRSEQEIAGYRDVLATIHSNHANINLSSNIVLQFHRDLYQYAPDSGGKWKPVDNTIEEVGQDGKKIIRFQPVPAWQTSDAMDRLHEGFQTTWEGGKVEPLVVIAAYVLDFLCIHPFRDGNGRMARLLTLQLLYRAGLGVGRIISLEKLIEQSRESYYDTLYQSSQHWHEGDHDIVPWMEYLLGIVLKAYRDMESRVEVLVGGRGAKTEMVLAAIHAAHGDFAVSELHEQCPTVSLDMIRKILRDERDSGHVECLGRGKAARWRRIN